MTSLRFAASTVRDLEAARRRELEEQIDENTRAMQLARGEGLELDVRPHYDGYGLWFVPDKYLQMVGCQAAVVRR